MQKTRIEWCDYTINPVKGLCPMHCKTPEGYEYCYAAGKRGLYKRFKWNPEIRFESDAMDGCLDLKTGSKVFVGSTMELFGEWVRLEWLRSIFGVANICPDITFIFLTKQPQNLAKWSPFPKNCWVGVSATNAKEILAAGRGLERVEASVRFLSLEPLLGHIGGEWLESWLKAGVFNWLIIGEKTPYSVKTAPRKVWVKELIEAADKAGIPVFLKKNLKPLFIEKEEPSWMVGWKNKPGELRQEFPCCQ